MKIISAIARFLFASLIRWAGATSKESLQVQPVAEHREIESRFEICLARLLGHEGGFNDDPHDNGGRTMQGVTQSTYDAWCAREGMRTRPVEKMTRLERDIIYRTLYWDAASCEHLPIGVDYAVFDAAVNSGPRQAVKWLQATVWVIEDGICGPKTIAATNARNLRDVVEIFSNRREAFLRAHEDWERYKNGWTARVLGVKAAALKDIEEVAHGPSEGR